MENNFKFKKEISLLERELKYKGTILSVYKDKVQIGDNIAYWDHIEHKGASAILPILPNGNIILVRQYRLSVDKWTLEIPAGKFEESDTDPKVCAIRELEEETGYKSDNVIFLCTNFTAVAYCTEKIYIYLARDLKKGIMHNDKDEETIVEEWTIDDIEKEIYDGKIEDAKTISAIMLYINKYKTLN